MSTCYRKMLPDCYFVGMQRVCDDYITEALDVPELPTLPTDAEDITNIGGFGDGGGFASPTLPEPPSTDDKDITGRRNRGRPTDTEEEQQPTRPQNP